MDLVPLLVCIVFYHGISKVKLTHILYTGHTSCGNFKNFSKQLYIEYDIYSIHHSTDVVGLIGKEASKEALYLILICLRCIYLE